MKLPTSSPWLIATLTAVGLTVSGYAKDPPAPHEVKINISTKGNELAFDKNVLHAHSGQEIALTFENASEPSSGMSHTWVLVKPGTQEEVASKAVAAGATRNYVPEDPNVLASTSLVAPGKSATIHFKAPSEPGKYPYLCTFPGHAALLKGTLEVD